MSEADPQRPPIPEILPVPPNPDALHPNARLFLGGLMSASVVEYQPDLTQIQAEGFVREVMTVDYPQIRSHKPDAAALRSDEIRLHVHGLADPQIAHAMYGSLPTNLPQGRNNTFRLFHSAGYHREEFSDMLSGYLSTFDQAEEVDARTDLLEKYSLTQPGDEQLAKRQQEAAIWTHLQAAIGPYVPNQAFDVLRRHLIGEQVDLNGPDFTLAAGVLRRVANNAEHEYRKRRESGLPVNGLLNPAQHQFLASLLGDRLDMSRGPRRLQDLMKEQQGRKPGHLTTLDDLKSHVQQALAAVAAMPRK